MKESGPEQLQDSQDNIIDITETGCLVSLGMMQTTSPIDGNVRITMIQSLRGA
jgi:hypothetical protein